MGALPTSNPFNTLVLENRGRVPNYEFLTCGCGKGLVYFFLEGLFPLPLPDGFPVLLGAFRGLPLLFPPLLLPLPPFFAMFENQTQDI